MTIYHRPRTCHGPPVVTEETAPEDAPDRALALAPVTHAPRSSARDGKLAARLALAIEHEIASARWPIGHLIGSESELRQRYRVSRQVLREAIRLVEHHQVASMRRGPQGGLVVSAPDAAAATSAVLMYLEFADTTLDHVLAVRMTLEPIASALAAEHITEAGIAELRAALADEAADGLHVYAPGRL
ncbi:MAG: FadR family transcriptional regulator, partial [Pseudonocardia sp.]|nr:FadR family transcriptional regulator [Pseudonocardia sp.]